MDESGYTIYYERNQIILQVCQKRIVFLQISASLLFLSQPMVSNIFVFKGCIVPGFS